MVKVNRMASVPLIVNDPYFSIWSPADKLTDATTQSWTGKEMPVRGEVKIGHEAYVFMGWPDGKKVLPQLSLDVTATQTQYIFENELLRLVLTFSTELDLKNLTKVSEPVTMITTEISQLKTAEPVTFTWFFDQRFCYEGHDAPRFSYNTITTPENIMHWFGKARQTPLNSSGDLINIDWGHLYIAGANKNELKFADIAYGIQFSYVLSGNDTKNTFLAAYDDLNSIEYFGEARPAYWHNTYTSLRELLADRLANLEVSLDNCARIDTEIEQTALAKGGENLEFLTAGAYRQSISAHKLITDHDGNVIFLSKECSSNGCIGTVDVSYPSIPLYLKYQPELVKGMIRPIYKLSKLPVWEFPYAPHDVGRYPYANGQVYGENSRVGATDGSQRDAYDTIFPLYSLPAGQNVYLEKYQMPIEECGNMLLMISAVYQEDHDAAFFNEHLEQNIQWADYLVEHGQNPENQLCTDDFAGHLAHNANLSLKAITALGLFGKTLQEMGSDLGEKYFAQAQKMAKVWEKESADGEWARLAFDQKASWSLKYNMVWDKVYNLGLFNPEIMKKEFVKYAEEANRYGLPLDNRATYTKADWIMWVAAMADSKGQLEQVIAPVKKYLAESKTRVPFSDWYDTLSGDMVGFKNRTVVGACFMPFLVDLTNK